MGTAENTTTAPSGTSWIYNLPKQEITNILKLNGVEVDEGNTYEVLRKTLVDYVKQEIAANRGANIKIALQPSKRAMEVSATLDFDIKKDDWEMFTERIEQYFIANDIESEAKKRAVLLSKVSAESYALIRKICAPDKPATKTFASIVSAVKTYVKPPASHLVYRANFRQRAQGQETITEYVAALKDLANDCEFTNLEEQVLDQLVSGLRSTKIKADLLKIENPTLQKAIKWALAAEAAEKGADKMRQTGTSNEDGKEIHKIQGQGRGRGRGRGARGRPRQEQNDQHGRKNEASGGREAPQRRRSPLAPGYTENCYCCGKPNHRARDCKYRGATCDNCKCKGHLKDVCSVRRPNEYYKKSYNDYKKPYNPRNTRVGYMEKQNENYSDTDSISDELNVMFPSTSRRDIHKLTSNVYIPGKARVAPQFMTVKIMNKKRRMEIDSGASMSVIPERVRREYFPEVKMCESDLELTNHDGSVTVPVGMLKRIEIEANGHVVLSDAYVTQAAGPPIIGRPWLEALGLWPLYPNVDLHEISTTIKENSETVLADLLAENRELFSQGLGTFTKGCIKLQVKENCIPKYFPPRTVAFGIKDKVSNKLDRLVAEKVLEAVETSEWATPIVPVFKPNGDLRICADFKVTINPQIVVDRYPLPHLDHLLAGLQGGVRYSKIDLKEAYQQVSVDAESRQYLTISTHKGLFRYLKMPYGIASCPGFFQRTMEAIFKGVSGIVIFLDDIVVTGKDDAEHLANLKKVFMILRECGLKLRENKCEFFKKRISYLGYVIDKDGIRISPDKYKAITEMKTPENANEVQIFIGKVNYYCRLFKNRAENFLPLYESMKNKIFKWTPECQKAFDIAKEELKTVLTQYDPKLPLILTCDASPLGLGAVLSHPSAEGERPIMYASKSLTQAQKGYSQIDREAAAIIFGVTKFYDFVYGRQFILRTDNKPLSRILGPKKGIPQIAACRLQNWAFFLTAFNYTVECIRSEQNASADTLSRLPIEQAENEPDELIDKYTYLHYVVQSQVACLDYKAVARETSKDKILSVVKRLTEEGWSERKQKDFPDEIKPFASRKDELTIERGCLMWGCRVIIPVKLQSSVIEELHGCHFGIVKMKSIARAFVWWPGVDKMLEETAKYCKHCIEVKDNPKKPELIPWRWPDRPWYRIHADFAGPYMGHTFLLIIDAYSKWPEAFIVNSMSATATMAVFRKIFTTHGLPNHLVTDCGTQFKSEEFQEFLKKLGVKHTFTAPYHPATNGAAENFVKTFKRKLKAIVSNGLGVQVAIERFLFGYRTTKHVTTGETPAKLLFNRELRTPLHLLRPENRSIIENKQQDQVRFAKGVRKVEFEVGDVVVAKDFRKDRPRYSEGQVVRKVSQRGFEVQFTDGETQKRHADQIMNWRTDRKESEGKAADDDEEIATSVSPPRKSLRNKKPVVRFETG